MAYFSWSGNTQEMATYISEQTGGGLLEIQPETPYPTDYSECGAVAQEERDSNARAAISNLPESVDKYDTILIGYPIWWHTAPMIIGTFLESYDLTGKDVYPFTQSSSMIRNSSIIPWISSGKARKAQQCTTGYLSAPRNHLQ